MSTDLYVTGARSRKSDSRIDEWNRFDLARIIRVSQTTGTIEQVVDYQSPQDVRPDDLPSISFRAGCLRDGKYYACTGTEILIYSFPDFELEKQISLPFFNDIHHVTATERNTLLVVVTGLDMVAEISMDGEVEREWAVNGTPVWSKFSPDVDYRKITTTKPHESHPNHVFVYENDVWATRFHDRDAICLTSEKKRIDIGVESPHDGDVHGDKCYFTTINGCIAIADLKSLRVEVINIGEILNCSAPLGWCRGLKVMDDNKVVIGFSRLRRTTNSRNLEWVKAKLSAMPSLTSKVWVRPPPTRLIGIDLSAREQLWEINLEDHGLNAIYSII